MKMRQIISICETLPPGWDLGGCWITDTGEIIDVNHAIDYHHSDIAMDNFGDESMTNDDGEYDDYSRDMAQEMAYSEGWIRVSIRGDRSFSVEWRTQPSKEAKRVLFNLVELNPTPYQTYEVETDDFQTFDNIKEFQRYLRKALR